MAALGFLGMILMFVGGIMLLVKIFSESVLWGIASMIIPFVALWFVITHWDTCKTAFLIQLLGGALLVVSAVLGAPTPAATN